MKKLSLLGNLGKDATITQSGDHTAINLSLATTERHKDSTGVWGDLMTWTNVTYWGKKEQLEKLLPHLKKGKKIYVDGKFYVTIHNDRPSIQMTAQNLHLC